jgi:hypothetical protein
MITITNIRFNKIVAKNNFKWENTGYLKDVLEEDSEKEGLKGIVESEKEAKEFFLDKGHEDIKKSVAGEAIAFLADGSAVSVRLIQIECFGLLQFRYVIKVRNI